MPTSGFATGRTVGAGATFATFSQVVSALATGLAGIVVARSLGAGGTGSFNVVLTALLLLVMPSTLGLEYGINYHVAGRRWPPPEALRQSQIAALLLGLAATGVGLALGAAGSGTVFDDVPIGTLALGLAAMPFYVSWFLGAQLALAVGRFETYGIAFVAQSVGALALILVLAPTLDLGGAVAAVFASHALTSIGIVAWAFRTLPSPEPGWLGRLRPRIRMGAAFGIRPALNNTLQQLNYRGNLLLLNAVAASAVAGQYAVALTLSWFTTLLPQALGQVVLPRISALDSTGDRDEGEMVILKAVRHALLLVAGATAILVPGLLLVPLVYGPGFEEAIEFGWILTPGVAALGVGFVLAAIVTGRGHPEHSLHVALIITPVTMALYAVLVPTLEGVGAALGATISYTGWALLWYLFFRRVSGIRGLAPLLPRRAELADYGLLVRRARDHLGQLARAS
jgi:O-antigen/teichoic acid export membrane protein